jgi:hypothetical protein
MRWDAPLSAIGSVPVSLLPTIAHFAGFVNPNR